jgi:hypothetical protein
MLVSLLRFEASSHAAPAMSPAILCLAQPRASEKRCMREAVPRDIVYGLISVCFRHSD